MTTHSFYIWVLMRVDSFTEFIGEGLENVLGWIKEALPEEFEGVRGPFKPVHFDFWIGGQWDGCIHSDKSSLTDYDLYQDIPSAAPFINNVVEVGRLINSLSENNPPMLPFALAIEGVETEWLQRSTFNFDGPPDAGRENWRLIVLGKLAENSDEDWYAVGVHYAFEDSEIEMEPKAKEATGALAEALVKSLNKVVVALKDDPGLPEKLEKIIALAQGQK